jgi:hypothetical protein
MLRWLVRCMSFAAPLLLAGCASDPREAKITAVITYVDSAATSISRIKDSVAAAIKKAENKKLDGAELKKAVQDVADLKDLAGGKKMQGAKQDIEALASSTPKEERAALAEKFRGKLSSAMARLDEERRALEKTILEAEAIDPDSLKELRSKLTEAEGSFVMLARQR